MKHLPLAPEGGHQALATQSRREMIGSAIGTLIAFSHVMGLQLLPAHNEVQS